MASALIMSKLRKYPEELKRSARKMCYEVKCSTCGKTTWGGCGRHVPSVYKRVPEGQHCACRDWPGVKIGDQSGTPSATAADSETSSVCAIL